ncbi:hypothetical protein DXV75_15550 [Alteromonas aestuariivivens]|uniref:Uncharacterized protein n=1 Tax=Alteromonas aestuariivivens TaxID=1938339 RepID=A0A3D8M4N3_9ALTE|nr:hypothetical protein [Alteromonas aestuariivivens]RDV24102.1 hypothetical protein DXV75_15550 [Alteromonas aestuariivivens]
MKPNITGLWIEQATNTDLPDDYWLPPQAGDKFRVEQVSSDESKSIYRVHHYREKIPGQVETIEIAFFIDTGQGNPYNFVQVNNGSKVFLRDMEFIQEKPDVLRTYLDAMPMGTVVTATNVSPEPLSTAEASATTRMRVWDCRRA